MLLKFEEDTEICNMMHPQNFDPKLQAMIREDIENGKKFIHLMKYI
jgi:hypothetical protein